MRRVLVAFIAIAVPVAIAFALASGRTGTANSPTPTTSEHPTAIPAAARTVVVSREMPMPSAHERRLSAMLEDGEMPHRAMRGEVMTDTDCTPDENMISHCRNVVRIADGSEIVLRHPHDMRSIPCLAPGESVRLVPATV